MNMSEIKICRENGNSFSLERGYVAHINPRTCINCGTCRENCPVEAITEAQRWICRVCPACSDNPVMRLSDIDALVTKQSCTTACPLGISPQGYIGLARNGKKEEAFKLIWSKNPLPSVCGRICHHPCEQVCKRGVVVDDPMAIRDLKRYLDETVDYTRPKYPKIHDERIAIIGAGPAGLSAGHFLSVLGYDVTIFEGSTEPGGMLVRGIPEFRLDRSAVRKDIAKLQEAGLKIECQAIIGKKQVKELQEEYDAIVVAAGTPHGKEITWVPKWNYDAVYTALQFMDFVNNDQNPYRMPSQNFVVQGKEGIVIGGGSVAMDAARTAIRLGAKKVTAVCLEEGENVPAHAWERKEAEEEGVEILEGYSPKAYTGRVNTLEGIDFAKVSEYTKDENGKITFRTNDKEVKHLPADFCIVAIGQYGDDWYPEADGKAVFYAGDIAKGRSSVIDALASGRKAAFDVDAAIQGRVLRNAEISHELHEAPREEKIYPCNRRKTLPHERPMVEAQERVKNFDDVEKTYTDRQAYEEELRCLGCGYEMIDEDKCIGCGVCQTLCPEGDVITMVKK
jgi:NADPH-dependent glutamate synthase beta subunit-like oxidoreductase/NAD-dependent dihydropyrimidine dehydrogenase PreA subunit